MKFMRALVGFAVFGLIMPLSTHAASLYIDPDTGTFGPGDTFVAAVRLDNEGECINAAHVEIKYPIDKLRAVDFSRGNSIFSLWVEEPKIDTDRGIINFTGGIPGGYCGRIAGDPALTNVLGRIVFTVMQTTAGQAQLQFAASSEAYVNDGQGTRAQLSLRDSTIKLAATSTGIENPWVREVSEDTIPPEAFTINVESTKDVFNGAYYLVFSTTDKQSGIDHYELFRHNGWIKVMSPYKLSDLSLRDIQVRAIDKAGNVRVGSFNPEQIPPSQAPKYDLVTMLVLIAILIVLAVIKIYIDRKKSGGTPTNNLSS